MKQLTTLAAMGSERSISPTDSVAAAATTLVYQKTYGKSPTDLVAAAATTLVYQKTCGSNDDNDQDDEDYESGLVVDVSSGDEDYLDEIESEDGKNNDDYYKLDGLCYSDDEAFLFDRSDSEDKT